VLAEPICSTQKRPAPKRRTASRRSWSPCAKRRCNSPRRLATTPTSTPPSITPRAWASCFAPTNPLLPNYKYVPIGYHGRASSIVASGQRRFAGPRGQTKSRLKRASLRPNKALDYELEVGIFVGPGNPLGRSHPHRRGRGPHLRSVPCQRLVGARHPVVGVSAARPIPGKEPKAAEAQRAKGRLTVRRTAEAAAR
jgi:hypothetical protein